MKYPINLNRQFLPYVLALLTCLSCSINTLQAMENQHNFIVVIPPHIVAPFKGEKNVMTDALINVYKAGFSPKDTYQLVLSRNKIKEISLEETEKQSNKEYNLSNTVTHTLEDSLDRFYKEIKGFKVPRDRLKKFMLSMAVLSKVNEDAKQFLSHLGCSKYPVGGLCYYDDESFPPYAKHCADFATLYPQGMIIRRNSRFSADGQSKYENDINSFQPEEDYKTFNPKKSLGLSKILIARQWFPHITTIKALHSLANSDINTIYLLDNEDFFSSRMGSKEKSFTLDYNSNKKCVVKIASSQQELTDMLEARKSIPPITSLEDQIIEERKNDSSPSSGEDKDSNKSQEVPIQFDSDNKNISPQNRESISNTSFQESFKIDEGDLSKLFSEENVLSKKERYYPSVPLPEQSFSPNSINEIFASISGPQEKSPKTSEHPQNEDLPNLFKGPQLPDNLKKSTHLSKPLSDDASESSSSESGEIYLPSNPIIENDTNKMEPEQLNKEEIILPSQNNDKNIPSTLASSQENSHTSLPIKKPVFSPWFSRYKTFVAVFGLGSIASYGIYKTFPQQFQATFSSWKQTFSSTLSGLFSFNWFKRHA